MWEECECFYQIEIIEDQFIEFVDYLQFKEIRLISFLTQQVEIIFEFFLKQFSKDQADKFLLR